MITLKNKYENKSKLLFTDIDSLMYKLKLKMSMKILSTIKECLISVIIRLIQNTVMSQTN